MSNFPTVKLPYYHKLAQIIIGLIAFFYLLYVGQHILVPIIYAVVIGILLNPAVNFLTNHRFNRVLAISIVLLLAIILVVILVYFLSSQLTLFSDAFPALKQKFLAIFSMATQWVSTTFHVSNGNINAWIAKTQKKGLDDSGAMIAATLGTIRDIIEVSVLLPVYVFMILFYKPLLLEFISQLFSNSKQDTVSEVLTETRSLIQNYLFGLFVEFCIVSALNSAGLLILGINYAILLGIIGGLLNAIPYLGGIIAIALPMIIALATKSPIYALLVFAVYLLIQFVDNHYIVPKIVASKVKINALVSIVVVLVGGAIWGVPGMFLSIPLTAIIKVIFDRVGPLKPFGYLLGDTMPEEHKPRAHSRAKK